MDKIIKLPISKFINTKYRDYAIYVLQQRGIPSFYDALTPVQRYILMNSPQNFTKTLSVTGECIKAGYHHGDSSLTKAICKLTRPFGSALQLLEGYGFFGSEVCPEPAAARYTSVKISPKANEILKKYKYLITKEEEGPYNTFWLDIPIGLTTSIIGISVGYKSTVLPRKIEDIQKYLEGNIKTIKPYFRNFEGTIKKYNNLKNAWIISSNININGNKIEIKEIPPILKYSKAINRLDYLFNKYEGKIKVLNNSNTKVNIDIIYLGKNKEEWEEIQQFVYKVFSVIVKECPIFIKDNQTLVYDTVEQYLDDYKWQLKRLEYYKNSYEKDFINKEIDFNNAKKEFIKFILQKKRTIKEIDEFFNSYEDLIKDRLERMTSKKFTDDELNFIDIELKDLKNQLKVKEKEYKISKELFEKEIDPTLKRGIISKKNTIDLFETSDLEEDDGIYIWNGTDVFDKDEENIDIE